MAKNVRSYMVRRGRRYLIERTADGTFGRFVPVNETKKASKKTGGKKSTGKLTGGFGKAAKKAKTKSKRNKK